MRYNKRFFGTLLSAMRIAEDALGYGANTYHIIERAVAALNGAGFMAREFNGNSLDPQGSKRVTIEGRGYKEVFLVINDPWDRPWVVGEDETILPLPDTTVDDNQILGDYDNDIVIIPEDEL